MGMTQQQPTPQPMKGSMASGGQGMKGMPQQGMSSMSQAMFGPGVPQAGGINQQYSSQTPGLYSGGPPMAQGFQGIGQGFQGNQGMMAPGSSFGNPGNGALAGGGGAGGHQNIMHLLGQQGQGGGDQGNYMFNPAKMVQ